MPISEMTVDHAHACDIRLFSGVSTEIVLLTSYTYASDCKIMDSW